MYAAKPVLCWIIILCCWQETLAKPRLSMLNRTRVALAGESLDFNLSVFIPANYTTSKLVCYTQNKMTIWNTELKSEISETKQSVRAHITMNNSSSSGKYYFSYANQEVHWVVHVRDKGYQEPPEELDSAIITMMAFSAILLIFAVAGSLYILKSYKFRQRVSAHLKGLNLTVRDYTLISHNIKTTDRFFVAKEGSSDYKKEHPPCRDNKNEVAEQRPGESDEVILDEDAASASLYTTLQCRSGSIYDTLHSDTMHVENTKKKKSEKHCNAQDEVFDSVYENL